MVDLAIWGENIKNEEVTIMRLDKFLKVSRIIKRRPVAKEVADKGRIQVNGILAKSSSNVKIGDQIKIQFGNKILEVEVLELRDSTKKEDAEKMYQIISEKRVENSDNLD
jgi:ribosomal 50S subunit-recycling heat shock protein